MAAAESSRVAFEAVSRLSFEEAAACARAALEKEGFGVMSEIDVKATMKKRLGLDVPPYLILGACHPPSAHRALEAAPEVGVLLPCNVSISVEGGKTVVRAMNPGSVMAVIGKRELEPIGAEVGAALQRVVDACRG